MKKKLLSILLCIAMLFGWMPNLKAMASKTNEVTIQWKNYRNSDGNMAITSSETPITSQQADLKWAKSLGSDWAANPSVQIIVDNSIVVMSGTKIYKLSMETGKVKASADMVGSPSYGYTPPTYGDGMIFAPLGNGTIQAFDAATLKSLWVYRDAQKGQALSPITYSDGCIYTGFWNKETDAASFVCIAADDEDPSRTNEEKPYKWTYSHVGGFYWAGAAAIGDFIVVQSDDGTSSYAGSGKLYVFNKLNGSVIDSADISGDGRSSIAYDSQSGRIYFTTKNGKFYTAAVNPTTGAISNLSSISLGTNVQSTSTPVVYKGYAFVGASDKTVKMIDINTMEVKSSVSLAGYPQCSLLLSNAYVGTSGKVYLYSTYNSMPGGITVIEVDLANVVMTSQELYDASGYENYCTTSLICDNNGTIYYKNDSGYVFAVGKNEAYLETLTSDKGSWGREYSSSSNNYDYEIVVKPGEASVKLDFTASQGSSVSINGEANTEGSYTAHLGSSGTAGVKVDVSKGNDSRTYNITIREAESDASIRVVYSNSNSITSSKTEAAVSGNTYYAFSSALTAPRIWFDTADPNAAITSYEIVGGDTGKYTAPTTSNVYNGNAYRNRYYISAYTNGWCKVKVTAAAEDGETSKDYYIIIAKDESLVRHVSDICLSDSSLNLAEGEQKDLTAQATYVGTAANVDTKIEWSSTNKGIASVDQNGRVTAKGVGSAVITAECGGASAQCKVNVNDIAGDINVYVSVAIEGSFAEGKNNTLMAEVPVKVSDDDKDGKHELYEVLSAVHRQYYMGEGTGYGTSDWGYGIYISQLWGVTTSSVGYYKNNELVSEDLSAGAENNDYASFFTYADTNNWSDKYTFFKERTYKAKEKADVELLGWSYAEDWSMVKSGISGIQMSVYNEKGEKLKQGSYTITDNGEGSYTISGLAGGTYRAIASSSQENIIVPAICTVTIQVEPEETIEPINGSPSSPVHTGDSSVNWIWMTLIIASLSAAVVILKKEKICRSI